MALSACSLLLASLAAAEPPKPPLSLVQAIELTLNRDPNIRLSKQQVEAARGSLMIAQGSFDGSLAANFDAVDAETPTTESSSVTSRSTSESLSWTQLLRSGQTLQPALSLDQDDSSSPVATGTVSFTLRQPLLRGRRPSVVTSDEQAAERELDAAQLDLLHLVSQRLFTVTNQYWSVRAAMLDLEILRETEKRSRQLLETTRRLVDADLTPAAELLQLEADLVSREATRIAGERSLFVAVQNLGAEIGLDADEIAGLGLPSDTFPSVEPDSIPESSRAYLAEAFEHRADLAASNQRLIASKLRLQNAKDNLAPQLDLVLTPSYTGLVEGDGLGDAFTSLYSNVPGLSATFGVRYLFPISNRVAKGAFLRSSSFTKQQALDVEARRIQIGADVPSALDAVRSNAERLVLLERAAGLFVQTLENEEKKLRVGSSILIDVINQRDRLTAAQQRLVSGQLALAQAIVALRFETGTLVWPMADGVQQINFSDLTTLPLRDP